MSEGPQDKGAGKGQWSAWVHHVRDSDGDLIAEAIGRAEADQIASEHSELLTTRQEVERLRALLGELYGEATHTDWDYRYFATREMDDLCKRIEQALQAPTAPEQG